MAALAIRQARSDSDGRARIGGRRGLGVAHWTECGRASNSACEKATPAVLGAFGFLSWPKGQLELVVVRMLALALALWLLAFILARAEALQRDRCSGTYKGTTQVLRHPGTSSWRRGTSRTRSPKTSGRQ